MLPHLSFSYQMTRGSLVLFVGLLSVVFLRRECFTDKLRGLFQRLMLSSLLSGHLFVYRALNIGLIVPAASYSSSPRFSLPLAEWLCLTGVMGGVALVGLSGMLKHTPATDLLVVNDEGSAEVALGIFFIMFAQVCA